MSVLLLDFEYFIEKSSTSQLKFRFPFSEDSYSYQEVELLVPKVPKSTAIGHFDDLSPLEFGNYTNNDI